MCIITPTPNAVPPSPPHVQYMDAELQQRAVEYRGLSARQAVAAAALQPLPKWDKRTSLLLRRLAEKEVCGLWEERVWVGGWCVCVWWLW